MTFWLMLCCIEIVLLTYLQRSPRPPSWITGVLLLRGGEGGEAGGRGGAAPKLKLGPQDHFPGAGAGHSYF